MKLQEESDGLQRKGGPDRENWLPVYAAGLSTFCVVTTEMLPVGLMTPIADDLQTSMGTAGLMLSLFGHRRRVWFRALPASPESGGGTLLTAGGLPRTDYPGFADEFAQLVKAAEEGAP